MQNLFEYDSFFPFDVIRQEQRIAIEFALNAFINEKKKFVILEMGTGCGKSAVGITILRYLASRKYSEVNSSYDQTTGGYVLTTQKILQEQYVNDFGIKKQKLLHSINSSANYQCTHTPGQSCGVSRKILSGMKKQYEGTEFKKHCESKCKYVNDKNLFMNSLIGITNFSYFLTATKSIKPRRTLVIDECHNIESELSKFVEVTFSDKFTKDYIKCSLPELPKSEAAQPAAVFDWIVTVYKRALQKRINKLKKTIDSALADATENGEEPTNVVPDKSKVDITVDVQTYDFLDKHLAKVDRFIKSYNPDNWIMNLVETPIGKNMFKKYQFKPIDISPFSDECLYQYSSNVLLMSATIIDQDVFCKSTGIDLQNSAFLRIASPFPIANRPIYYFGIGKMSMASIDNTLPKMLDMIKILLEQHANEKGIIHCVSFKIAQFLFTTIKSPRLLTHTSLNRDEILKYHISCPEPTVLLSPSMMEGVNLADSSSRFQILCKIPFPFLGDKVIKKRKLLHANWYAFQTAKSIIQSLGRSIRNDTDYAVSYILDEDWEYFFKCNRQMFPEDFLASIKN